MAEIVAAYAVPHTPSFVADVMRDGPSHEAARLFSTVKRHFDSAGIEVIVAIQNDHFNTFFLNNWPTFAIGTAQKASGPSDQTPDMPEYEVVIETALAQAMLASFVEADFDFSSSQYLTLDHSVLVPLHFMNSSMNCSIVPIYVNCLVPPLPSARRCYAMGQALRESIQSWPSDKKIALLASGSLSLEVGGPQMLPGRTFGVPDKEWASQVLSRIAACDHAELLAETRSDRIAAAGNVAGEILNWVSLLGAIGPIKPDLVLEQPELGNAFVAWKLNGGNDGHIRRP